MLMTRKYITYKAAHRLAISFSNIVYSNTDKGFEIVNNVILVDNEFAVDF
jgi:hypothetical protein